MPYYEDDIRAAFHSLAGQAPDARNVLTRVQEQLDPAERLGRPRPTGPRRSARRLLIPLAAAAAVIAVIATAVAITGGNRPRPIAPAPRPSQYQVPPYYMNLTYPFLPNQNAAVIRSTTTGVKIATVRPPRSEQFIAVSGASDDRTFALAAYPLRWVTSSSCRHAFQTPACLAPIRLYLARFNPATGAATLRALPIPAIHALDYAIALSPSGTELAVGTLLRNAKNVDAAQIREYSLTSGTVRVWQGQGYASNMVWAANGQLAFEWAGATDASGIRLLNTRTAGGGIAGASRLIVGASQSGHYAIGSPAFGVSGDGKTIVAPFVQKIWRNRPAGAEIRWYSIATGRETRVYTPPAASYTYTWQVVWTNSSGSKTVLYRSVPSKTPRSDYFGVVSGSKFMELPGLSASEFTGLLAAF
jgi:hypothetical protein